MKRSWRDPLVLLFIVVAVHGSSLRHGLILDDYNHRANLQAGDWSWTSLIEAAHLGGHGRRVEMWWQKEADLHFVRPLAFALMRLQYVVSGWQPVGMHAFSLLWAWAGSLVVLGLARCLLGAGRPALLAAGIFAVHPANAFSIRWIACQNQQMAAVFLLLAVWLYARFSGWNRSPDTAGGRPTASAAGSSGGAATGAVLAVIFAIIALACREDALIFGPLVFLGDLLIRPQERRRRWPVYLAAVGITGGYLLLRVRVPGGLNMPGPPYAMPWNEPGFLRFVLDKTLYYLLGLFACVPIVGFGGVRLLQSVPVLFYGASLLVVSVLGVLVRGMRNEPALWVAILLLFMPMIPVLPVFASSHHLYVSSVGAALLLVLAARGVWTAAEGAAATGRMMRTGLVAAGALHVLVYAGLHVAYDQAAEGFHAAGELPVREVVELGRPLAEGDRLFFINLPLMAFNCPSPIREAAGVDRIEVYALTFSTGLLSMPHAGWVEAVGDRQIRIVLEGPGYFSGLIGENLLWAAGRRTPFAPGERFVTPDFSVEVVRSDSAGVRELLFSFERPLSDPGYHFYVGSPWFAAYPWDRGVHLSTADRP